jgi:ankyrin repeat protein
MNPKTIPQFKGRIGQQVQRINPYMNRTVIPTKEIDPLIISKLLLNVSTNENNILDLKEFILKNGITTNDMLNEEGQSILHIVLSNENLSKRQKLEIVKFFRDNFTLIESFDKNGLTPLHIACRLQLTDIVKELLDVGHNINITDNVYKSPLHYAVIGRQIEIPDRIDKKIFPKKKFKIKQNEIDNLSRELVKYINNTPEIKQFIQNQYNTIKNNDKIILKEIKN